MTQQKEGMVSTLTSTRFLNLKKVIFNGSDWFYSMRPNAATTVTIAPVLNETKVILLETFRPPVAAEGIAQRCLEWPAGMVGDERIGESVEQAIAAELLEETGFVADRVEICNARLVSSPGCSSETTVLALAFITQERVQQPVTDGGIITHWFEVDIAHLFDFLAQKEKEGLAVSLSVYSGLAFLCRRFPDLFHQKK